MNNLKLNLINYFRKSNKQWKTWMYGVYLSQKNLNGIYISKLRLWMEFLGNFFYGVWYWYTWIKSRTIKIFKVFGWNFIQKNVFFAFLNNKCITIYIFRKKITAISKRTRFYKWALHYFFNFLLFGIVSWTTNMGPYAHWKIVSYILYVH